MLSWGRKQQKLECKYEIVEINSWRGERDIKRLKEVKHPIEISVWVFLFDL